MAGNDVTSRRRQAADRVARRAEYINAQDASAAVVEGPARSAYANVIALYHVVIGLHPDLCAVAGDHIARSRRCSADCVVTTCGDADAGGVAQIIAACVVGTDEIALDHVSRPAAE